MSNFHEKVLNEIIKTKDKIVTAGVIDDHWEEVHYFYDNEEFYRLSEVRDYIEEKIKEDEKIQLIRDKMLKIGTFCKPENNVFAKGNKFKESHG